MEIFFAFYEINLYLCNLKTTKTRLMMIRKIVLMMFAWLTISMQAATVTDTIFNRYAHEEFAFGADVGFVPMMESWGTKWLDKHGVEKDILQILKETGINNIRLRVWTVTSGASSKPEVVAMCRRAKALGLGVMIDFHYSDSWADPGKQNIPAAWTDHSVDALSKNIYDHTYDVLSAIKAVGVVPKWVQVGNETKRGMLYPVGQTNQGGAAAFAKFVQSGYNAVKAVDSTMQVIVHLPDGHNNSLYRGIFDGLKKNGAKWDIIGLSAYPRWSHLDGPTMITKVMANINDLKSRYGTPCMVVETGHYPSEAVVGNQYLVGLMDAMIKNGDLGCFYWEPESMGGYDMGAWDEATRKPTVMMDAFLGVQHTTTQWLMKTKITSPTKEQVVTENLVIKATAEHIRDRIRTVDFYLDNDQIATLTASPYEWETTMTEPGLYTAGVKVTDTDNLTQTPDAIPFFFGESGNMKTPVMVNKSEKGGTATWAIDLKAAGKYRLVFKYTSAREVDTKLSVNGDSLARLSYIVKANAYVSQDIDMAQAGRTEIVQTALDATGLPSSFTWLRVFPLEGQPLPTLSEQTGISNLTTDTSEMVDVYSLSGVYLRTIPLSQLGHAMGNRTSAVVNLPQEGKGKALYVVRKQVRR